MGDFERHTATVKPNDTKKLVMVFSLGAVLLGLVAMQILKSGGPQAASGSPMSAVALSAGGLPEDISPTALSAKLNELKADPTQDLLRQDLTGDHSLDSIPHNPFTLSEVLSKLPVPVVASTTPATKPVVSVPNPNPGVQSQALRAEDFKLVTIVNGDMAILNGKIVQVGDVVSGARVVGIRADAVTLQAVDAVNGPTLDIALQSRLKN